MKEEEEKKQKDNTVFVFAEFPLAEKQCFENKV